MSKKSGRLRIEYRSPHELRPRADNAKVHSPQQIKKLEKSIERFGFVNPVLISDDNEIGGHGRVEAAKEAGLPLIPTVRLSSLTPAERLAYSLADNRLADSPGTTATSWPCSWRSSQTWDSTRSR
jgi:ParB-like chromosome segregation protein Spo0J